jgi:hypothetical protein
VFSEAEPAESGPNAVLEADFGAKTAGERAVVAASHRVVTRTSVIRSDGRITYGGHRRFGA